MCTLAFCPNPKYADLLNVNVSLLLHIATKSLSNVLCDT